jgi:predicted transcriptional regulator
MLQM